MSTGSEQLDALPHLNAKQRSRIQKRRLARQKLQEVLALKKSRVLPPQPNNHPSGCMRPPRGPDGRFLTPEQIATKELEKLTIREVDIKPVNKETLLEHIVEKPKL